MTKLETLPVLLYDGRCGFCEREVQRLLRLSRWKIRPKSFHDAAALKDEPSLSYEHCMKAIHLILPDGRIFAGAEAVARSIALNPILGWLAWIYYLPGIRQAMNAGYRLVARNRYRFHSSHEK